MLDSRYPSASAEEIKTLERFVKRASPIVSSPQPSPARPPRDSILDSQPCDQPKHTEPGPSKRAAAHHLNPPRSAKLDYLQHIEVTRPPLAIDNPVILLSLLMPEVTLHKWQFEVLMQSAGYLIPGRYAPSDKVTIDHHNQFHLVLPAGNGSGKDAIIIAGFAVWFALIGARNRVIITTSSHEQLKFQTEPGIRELCLRANKKLSTRIFRSTQFHHAALELGSEIKAFVTDEPGNAEGYHAWSGGKLAKIVNEAKSVPDIIFDATERWTGVSHFLEVSSPGRKMGHMYNQLKDCVMYPAPVELNRPYYRKVTQFECPHISPASIQRKIHKYGENSPLVRSSVFAEFSDYNEPVVIPYALIELLQSKTIPHRGADIGIGLDLAAGGDETGAFVRKGNKVVHHFFFRNADTELEADLIDKQLSPWKHTDYTFRSDDGGIGRGINDKLTRLGWRIQRRNNQSPAFNKREFLNLGAEMWFRVRRLIERQAIILPMIDLLLEQLTSRRFRGYDTTQGRFALQSKPEARAEGLPSPDRADAFVLCFSSYKPDSITEPPKDDRLLLTPSQLVDYFARGLHLRDNTPVTPGRFTLLDKTYI